VESLTAARKAAVSGSEPSDAVRVVNAVLTAIDSFRTRKNVLLLTTSNVSEAIDVAFVDRADIKALVGPPGTLARYDILASCLRELARVGLVTLQPPGAALGSAREARAAAESAGAAAPQGGSSSGPSSISSAAPSALLDLAASASLWRTAAASQGFSGRTLRKLPLAAHALFMRGASSQSQERRGIPAARFAEALFAAVREERASRVDFKL
jgi:SpoVK/Ycf46/Vps4 family AAA+-type ATPase